MDATEAPVEMYTLTLGREDMKQIIFAWSILMGDFAKLMGDDVSRTLWGQVATMMLTAASPKKASLAIIATFAAISGIDPETINKEINEKQP
jgi:hypothetical protein